MVAKFCLVLLMLCALQINALSIKDAEKAISDVVEHLADGIKDAVDDLTEVAKKHVDKVGADVTALVSGITEQIEAAADNECVKEAGASLDKVAEDSVDAVIKCGTDKVKEAADIATNIQDELVSGVKAIRSTIDDVKECDKLSPIQAAICKSKTTIALGAKVTSVVANVSGQATAASTLIASIKVQLEICAASKAAEALIKVTAVGTAVAKCLISG